MSWVIPTSTDWMRKQRQHKPTMDYAQDIYEIVKELLPPGFTALEVGGAWGVSALAILEAGARHLETLDPDPEAKARSEAVANGYGDKHAMNYVRSGQYWKENKTKFDLIYIDGSHNYEDVKVDLYEAWQRLNTGGYLMADDWDHPNNVKVNDDKTEADYGVSLACWEFFRDNPCPIGTHGNVLWFMK